MALFHIFYYYWSKENRWLYPRTSLFRGSLYRGSTVPTMCLIRKKEALLKTEWHLTQSQPLLHQIFKEPSIFFFLQEKKKQIKTKKGLQTVSSTWLLQLFPVSPSRKESRLAWSLGIKTSFPTPTNRTMKQSWKEKLSVIPSLARAVLFLVSDFTCVT